MLPLVSTRRRDLDRPRAVELARQQLAADGVAHVVAEQREPSMPSSAVNAMTMSACSASVYAWSGLAERP